MFPRSRAARAIALIVAAIAVVATLRSGLTDQLSIEYLKEQQAEWAELFEERPFYVTGIFVLAYVVVTGLSLPGATIFTLASGALFGLLWGIVIVSIASTLGAALASAAARELFRNSL